MSDRRRISAGSGVALLFHSPEPRVDEAVERQLAAREAVGHAAGAAAERLLAAERIAAIEADHARQLAAIAAQHAAELETYHSRQLAALGALDAAFADALLPLALAVGRALLATEPPAATVESLVAEVLAALPQTAGGVLRAPPGASGPAPAGWTWREDPDLAPGTVVAEWDATEVSASLAARLAQLAHEIAP